MMTGNDTNNRSRFSTACFALLALVMSTAPSAQEVELKAATPWARNFFLSRSFQGYVDKLNAAGKGVVRINYIGGPEAVPATEQPSALRRGVIDMFYGAASYMLGDFPEADALSGGTRNPAELRANGGYEVLDEILQKKMNAKFLANPDTGWSFILYLSREPKRTASNNIDLRDTKLRSHPLYRDFLSALGADNLMIPAGEVFTAFERNMVQGLAFPEIGIRDLGIEKFIRYRVSPKFFQGDIVMLVNLNKWRSLPEAARKTLASLAISHEEESRKYFLEEVNREMAKLDSLGIKEIKLTGKAEEEYSAQAREVPWSRLAKADPTNVARLKDKFIRQ